MSASTSMDVRKTAEASEWLVRLREEAHDERTIAAWLRWCEADPANAGAFERVQSLWRQMDQFQPEELAPETPFPRKRVRKLFLRRAALFALAASCAAAALLLWHSAPWKAQSPVPAVSRENRSTILPDGSAVDLGAKTSVAVSFSEDARSLQLSAGEAYFEVRPDPKRPFTVRAGKLEVTAVGTAFDVNHQPWRTVVTVQEGVVAVRPIRTLHDGAAAPWRVASGYQFIYSEREGTAMLSSVDTSAVLAWRAGRLEYTRTPLAAVLLDINRYAEHPIELAEASLGDLTFTGTVFTDSISDWVTALPGALPVEVQRRDGVVVLKKASEGP
jgi:transmembrane sensor